MRKVGDLDRELIETRFLTDQPFRAQVLAAEDDLIDDYLDGNLSEDEKETFLLQYADKIGQRKLRIRKSLKNLARNHADGLVRPRAVRSRYAQWFSYLRLNPLIPIVTMVLIAAVFLVVWRQSKLAQRAEHHQIEQLLAELNSSGAPEQSSEIAFVPLSPLSLRSARVQNHYVPGDNRLVVELRLLWLQKDRFPTYDAEFRRLRSEEKFTIHGLQISNDGTIHLRLPSQILSPGTYEVSLDGITDNQTNKGVEQYTLTVG